MRLRLERVRRRGAANGRTNGCLGCALTAELAGQALAQADLRELDHRAEEAARYATRGGVSGCASCSLSLDDIAEGGVYLRQSSQQSSQPAR